MFGLLVYPARRALRVPISFSCGVVLVKLMGEGLYHPSSLSPRCSVAVILTFGCETTGGAETLVGV